MSEVTKPIALDESLHTTESTPRNLADVLAEGLSDLADAVKPTAADIPLSAISGMSADDVQEGLSELKQSLDNKTFNTWSDNTRCEFISGGYISMGAYMLINVVFKAKATASNTPSLVSISTQKPKVDTALTAIDITSGIASAISESIPCGIASSNGTIFIKKIETDHIYAITGVYLING